MDQVTETILQKARRHQQGLEAKKHRKIDPFWLVRDSMGADVNRNELRQHEDQIATNLRAAMMYAEYMLGGRFDKAEALILREGDPADLVHYAANVIKGRWEVAEGKIATSPSHSVYYAKLVLQDRFPLAEETILTDADATYEYAKDVIKGRWIEAEPIISRDARNSSWYARDVIKGRWIEAEPIISESVEYSLQYARHVLKGRFELGESVISKEGYHSFLYATKITNSRFELGEPEIIMCLNEEFCFEYASRFIPEFMTELEKQTD